MVQYWYFKAMSSRFLGRNQTVVLLVGQSTARFVGLSGGVLALKWGSSAAAGLAICPIHRLTGLFCPGCGATRSSTMLLEGDIHGAVLMYPPIVFVAPIAVMLAFGWISGLTMPAKVRTVVQRITPWGAFGMAAFGVLRNFDAFGFLRPE